jgi:hypothetical protein
MPFRRFEHMEQRQMKTKSLFKRCRTPQGNY